MTLQTINIGVAPNDGTGDPLRTAFDKTNQNFVELYSNMLGVNTDAQYTWSNTQTFNGEVSIANNLTVSGNLTTDVIIANGSLGTAGQVLTTNSTGVYWSTVSGGGGSVNVDAQYTWTNTQTFQNTITFSSTINGTANNASYLGGTAAAGYQTTAGLSSNVATLTANDTNFVGSVSAANVVSNAQLSGNLSNYALTSSLSSYQTTAGLSANVATLTANNTTYLNGQLASYYTNATNIATGTLPYAQLGGNVVNTTGSFTRTGVTTFNANVVIGTTAGISANGGYGSAGQVLTSNSTGVYWSTVSGGGGGSVDVNAQYSWTNTQTFSNTITFSSTINGTANNASYLGGTAAAGYQTTAGLSANVATLTSNNTSFVGSISAANVVSNAQLSANLGNYVTTTNLTNNLANYQTTAGLSANIASYLPTYTGVVNGASHTVGTSTIANATGFYTTGTVNAASHTVGTSFIANTTQVTTANPILINNNVGLRFQTVNTSSYSYFTQQTDDNFVFYTSNTSYGARAVWSIYANSITSNISFSVPVVYNSNVYLGSVGLSANGGLGTAGQFLTSNGSATYWSSASAASVNTSAQYTWTNTHTFSATITLNGNSSSFATVLKNAAETTTVSATAATGTINYDVTTQSVLYYTSNASANWTVNFRGSSGTSLNTLMSTGQTTTVVFLVTQGSTAYYNSAVQVDGSSVTPVWQGGSAPTAGNASGIDVYTYTIIKTGSAAYTVLASLTQFK